MDVILYLFLGCIALILGVALPCIFVWYLLVRLGLIPAPPYD